MLNSALLAIIEEAGMAVLTLTEGLEEQEFLRSRLTRAEVTRQLQALAASAADVPPATRKLLPELDWSAWEATARAMSAGGPAQDEALWFAAESLVPATLMWLRVYKKNQPEVFEFRP
jgi:uncharacterized protein with HEPN domain